MACSLSRSILGLAGGLLLATGSAVADTTLVFDVTGQPQSTVRLVDGLVRMDGGPAGWVLYRAAEDTAYMVNPDDKTYTRIDRDGIAMLGGQVNAARAQMEQELAKMPPEQRAMAEQMMARMLGKLDAPPKPPTPKATGESRKVGKVACDDYTYDKPNGQTDVLCVASAKALDVSSGEYDTVRKMYDMLSELSRATGFAAAATPNMDTVDGLPILVTTDGAPQQRLTSVSHDKIDRALYSLPAGYTERDPSSLK